MRVDPPAMSGPGHDWLDREAGPVVRPYTMTGGRVQPTTGGFDLVAFVVAAPDGEGLDLGLQPEHLAILRLVQEPISVAEVAAKMDLALGVVRVLLGDLLAEGQIVMHSSGSADPSDENLLKAVVDGLRSL